LSEAKLTRSVNGCPSLAAPAKEEKQCFDKLSMNG
jgi:hypothetical protein